MKKLPLTLALAGALFIGVPAGLSSTTGVAQADPPCLDPNPAFCTAPPPGTFANEGLAQAFTQANPNAAKGLRIANIAASAR